MKNVYQAGCAAVSQGRLDVFGSLPAGGQLC